MPDKENTRSTKEKHDQSREAVSARWRARHAQKLAELDLPGGIPVVQGTAGRHGPSAKEIRDYLENR